MDDGIDLDRYQLLQQENDKLRVQVGDCEQELERRMGREDQHKYDHFLK